MPVQSPQPERDHEDPRRLDNQPDRLPILQAMLDQVAQGIGMFDADYCLVAWNGQFRQLLDLPDSIVSQASSYAGFIGFLAERGDFGPPSASTDAAIRELTAALEEPYRDERMLPDGRILECRRNPLPGGGLVVVFTDVSERRHADYLVQDSERRLRTILEKAPVALAVVGVEDGEIKQINARFRKLFGLANQKLPDRPDMGQYFTTEDRERILNSASSALADFEAVVCRADGTEFWALVSSIRFVFEWAPAILMSFHDITDRRRAEAGLRTELSRKQGELGEARVLQLELAPSDLRGSIGNYEFHVGVVLEPAKEVGGDLVDFFHVEGNLLVLVLGDVSHKGAGAALFMARTHSLIRGLASRPDAGVLFRDPAEATRIINSALSRNNASCMFVTLLLATFDAATGQLAYVRAGHVPPLLRRASGAIERLRTPGGPPLGLMEEAIHKSATVDLKSGDQLVIVTDGITEAVDPSGRLFGEMRVEEFLVPVHPSEAEALKRLTAAVRAFEAGEPPADDVAALRLAIFDVPGQVGAELP